jgi:hypothetical protein
VTLPLTTTTVTISRRVADSDPYEDPGWVVVLSSVPAVVSGSTGTGRDVGGAQEVLTAQLFTDEGVDVRKADLVHDDTSGEEWRCQWVRHRYELGLGHVVAGLEVSEDAADG